MLIAEQEESDSPTLRPSPFLDPKHFDIPESPESRQDHDGSLSGIPFNSSGSDCSSDSHDGPLFTVSETPSMGPGGRNALGLEFTSETVVLGPQAVATPTPQAESLRALPHHQDARSCGSPNQGHHPQQGHLIPQPDRPADETLVGKLPQDICLGSDVNNACGPKVSGNNRETTPVNRKAIQGTQGLYRYPRQRADFYPGSCTPRRDDYLEDRSSTQSLGELEGAAAATGLNMYPTIAQPNDWEILRAPRVHPVPLPGEEEDWDRFNNNPDLGGWSGGTLDGEYTALSCLDLALSVPFSTEN